MAEGPVFKGLFIGGHWTEPAGPQTVHNDQPDERLTGRSVRLRRRSTMSAPRSRPPGPPTRAGRRLPAPKRGEILLEAATILKRRKEEIGRTVTREMGKVIAEGRGDVQESIDFVEYMAGEGRRLDG